MIVSVIACGPSAIECGAQRSPGVRIAVNDAYRYVEAARVVSMDGRWFENRAKDFCNPLAPTLYIRAKTIAKREIPEGCRYRTFECDRETTVFGDTASQLNGENSGYCALNLAYTFRPVRIYLYGFDMNTAPGGKDHFFGDYEWKGKGCSNSGAKFAKWAKEMFDAAEQFKAAGIEVINTNRKSSVKAFKFGKP